MPTVRLGSYIELGDYFVALCAAQGRNGWCSWARFMQDLEFGDGRMKIPVFRHRVPGMFATREESLDAALEYADQVVEEGSVEL
jgi:hypothetical protein